jgi:subtilisin family serine protease
LKGDIYMRTFTLEQFVRMRYQVVVILVFLLGLLVTPVCAEPNATAKPSPADIIHQAVAEGKIAYILTTPEKLKALLGKPQRENEKDEGDVVWLDMGYPDIDAWFRKRDGDTSFELLSLSIADKELDIGGMLQGQRQVIVRNIDDFREIGLRNVNLKNLDLSGEGDYLKGEDFDSLTQWPDPEKLPAGFDPQKLLEEGKNPGLGIRSLHERGINGKGIGIAILDQPLLLGHEEYSSRLIRYDATRSIGMGPQMHGSPIVGIAVGKTCGVAPRAFVFYYAAGSTSGKAQIQADYINEIVKYNETNPDTGRIRVISISASPERDSDNDAFLKAHKKALDAGILVVTCSQKFLDYGNLTLIEGENRDDPESYRLGGYCRPDNVLRVPVGNKTIATHQGTNVYKYERGGGMSWAAPYIAGLAALAFQVNPDLQPATIVEQLVKTATHTKAGPVVNPPGFIEAVRRLK